MPSGMTPGDDGLRVLDGMNAATFSWVPTENGGVLSDELPAATVTLIVAGAGEERARAAVEELTARSGDPFDGYDPVRGAGWRQVEDRSVAAGWMPVAQLRWEASGERSVYLSIAGDDGAVPLLAGASVVAVPAPVVEELAGRTVVRIGSVLRFVEGRTEVLLVAPGLSDAELGAVMGSLEPLSASEWAALRRTTADRLAATELLVESPVADADGGLVTAQLRRRGDEAVLCVRSGGQLDCSFVQISLAANGPLVPDASDALVFGVLRSGGRSWVVGTAGPDADSTVRLDLGERSIELVPTAAADGRRWYLWPVDEAALGDQLQLVLSGEGVVGGGSSPLALPR
ncbi:MAG: hypothetical protein IT196_24330 [Acidimicrobiales bacterium]|nr:hypothetical protein [Acidimicrobiales bacterium]